MPLFAHCPKRSVSLLVFFLSSGFVWCQTPEALRHCTTDDYKMDFYVSLKSKKVRYADTLSYYWFKAQKLYTTQGMSAGNILHGKFLKYHTNGQLAEQGEFDYGLKDGEWIKWYDSGKIQSKLTYKNGLLHGKFMVFDEEGNRIKIGKYKNGVAKIKPEKPIKIKADTVAQNDGFIEGEKAEEEPTFFERIFGKHKKEKEEDPEKIAKKLEKIRKKEERRKARENKDDSEHLENALQTGSAREEE